MVNQQEQALAAVEQQAAKVKKMKAEGADANAIALEVDALKELKAQLAALEVTDKFDRASLEELLKKRFFYAPAFNIYGGTLLSDTISLFVESVDVCDMMMMPDVTCRLLRRNQASIYYLRVYFQSLIKLYVFT